MPPRGRPTLVVLPPVASSSVASPSSASSCDAADACRSLALAASFAFRRSSALLAAYYFGPSSLSSSPRARTTHLTPTAIICRQVISLLRSTLSSNTCTSTDDVGAGVPFGCIVTADDGMTTGVSSSSESSSPASLRSAWLTLHAVNRRFIHPIFFSHSSALALVLSLFRTHVCMAIEAAFPTTRVPVVLSSPLLRAPLSFFRVGKLFLLGPVGTLSKMEAGWLPMPIYFSPLYQAHPFRSSASERLFHNAR